MKKNISGLLSKLNNKKVKYGGMSVLLTIGFIAVIVLVNVGISAIDEAVSLQIDMTQNELYTLSEQTLSTLDSLDKDIKIYTASASGEADANVTELLNTYSGASNRIEVINADPDMNPALFQPFREDGNNIISGSIIVALEDNSAYRVLESTDLYSFVYNEEQESYVRDQFIMESSLTTALEYLNTGYSPRAYFLTGHGELSHEEDETMRYLYTQLANDNFEVDSLSIKAEPDRLQAGDIVFIVGPTMDIDDEERLVLRDLFDRGGRIIMLLDPRVMAQDSPESVASGGFPNLRSLLNLYGISLDSGIVMDESASNYYSAYNFLVPALSQHDVLSALVSNNYRAIFPDAGSIRVSDALPEADLVISALATTSDQSWLQSDVNSTDTSAKGDDAQQGPFHVALAVEKTPSENEADKAKLVLIYSTAFADYQRVGAVSSSGIYINMEVLLEACSWMKDSTKDIYIRGKSLFESALIFDSMLQIYTVLIAVCVIVPLAILIMGVVVWLRRKNL